MGIPSSIEAIVSEIYDLWDRGEIGDNYFIRNIYFYDIIQMFIYFLFTFSFPTIVEFDTNDTNQWRRPRFWKKISSNLKIKFLSFTSEVSG